MVAAACNFGQDDDITVISVGRVEVHATHDAKLDLVAQIAGG